MSRNEDIRNCINDIVADLRERVGEEVNVPSHMSDYELPARFEEQIIKAVCKACPEAEESSHGGTDLIIYDEDQKEERAQAAADAAAEERADEVAAMDREQAEASGRDAG